jgi:hypothetical protein
LPRNQRLSVSSVCFSLAVIVGVCSFGAASARAEGHRFHVLPPEIHLSGNFARAQLLVAESDASGQVTARSSDLTMEAQYASSDPSVVSVSNTGRLLAVGDGDAKVMVTVEGTSREVPVTVSGVADHPKVRFLEDVLPVISRAGCNMGACHASQHGKGGFVLSVFGFDPDKDRAAIVRDNLQRRVDSIEPAKSLFLQKPTMQVPHGGGKRLELGSVDYQVLAAWLSAGAPAPDKSAAKVTKLAVAPSHRIAAEKDKQQLRVEAQYGDGTSRDVTAWAKFDSMDDGVLSVTNDGRVTVTGRGQAPIMVRFEGQAEIATFVVPYAESIELAGWQNNNFVDELAAAKFRELGIEPSPLCDDATFVRRAYLDCIGTQPTPEETLAFIESADPKKRERLIDRLLGLTGDPTLDIYNDQYAAYWSLKWSDLIRNTSAVLGDQGMWAMHNWVKESFRTNKPFDQTVRELVTARGSIYMAGPANYYRINNNSAALAEATAQLFLGVRLECAKCHHHPFEKYSQDDYYSFSAFFSRVGTKNSEEFGLFGRETVVVVNATGDVRNPRTNQTMQPTPLEGEPADHPLDRRIPLAQWLTAPDNSYFARSVVNRYMGYLLGRGLVEPIDDMRSTNPPSNVALMDALSKEFVDHKFDLKHLVRTIMVSRLYQLDWRPTAANASDEKFYSHYKVKRLAAEPLLDAIDRVTGVQTKFKDLPLGTRAIELPDAEYPDYFLTTFAKPRRASVCECERSPDANLAQALHTLNGDILAGKIADKKGRIETLLAEKKSHEEIVEQLYMATLCRPPTEQERELSNQFLEQSPTPKECYEDLLWALVNSKQFLFVH